MDSSENSVKLDFDERNNWYFYCTNKRAQTLKERLINLNNHSIHVKTNETNMNLYSFKKEDFTFKKKDGSSTIIQFEECNQISTQLINIQEKIKKLNKKEWEEQIKR